MLGKVEKMERLGGIWGNVLFLLLLLRGLIIRSDVVIVIVVIVVIIVIIVIIVICHMSYVRLSVRLMRVRVCECESVTV